MKVRNQRNRPDSRIDLAAEIESRFMSNGPTEDSTENPWTAIQGTTMTSASLGTPLQTESTKGINIDGDSGDAETQLDDIRSTYPSPSKNKGIEHHHLARQLQTLAQELKKSRSQAAIANATRQISSEVENWSMETLRLAQDSVKQWRTLQSYKMAEDILITAVDVRQANIFSYVMTFQHIFY